MAFFERFRRVICCYPSSKSVSETMLAPQVSRYRQQLFVWELLYWTPAPGSKP